MDGQPLPVLSADRGIATYRAAPYYKCHRQFLTSDCDSLPGKNPGEEKRGTRGNETREREEVEPVVHPRGVVEPAVAVLGGGVGPGEARRVDDLAQDDRGSHVACGRNPLSVGGMPRFSYSGPYGKGYPRTDKSFMRARHARPLYALRAGHPPNGLTSSSPLDTPSRMLLLLLLYALQEATCQPAWLRVNLDI
jgi:hypothetical protein